MQLVVHRLDDMEMVVDDQCVRQMLPGPALVGVGHVHTDAVDLRPVLEAGETGGEHVQRV